MDLFRFALLVVTGFTACAEFGSYAFVHPVLRHLPREYHLQVEQGLLRTFGRVMPTLMTLCVVLSVAYAVHVRHAAGAATWLFIAAAASFVAALISTVVFNVPINIATGKWDAAHPPPDWKQTRNRWELFQGLRSWLLLVGFILVCSAVTIR
ncbi:MAG: DUF1772 domain-containing protein [Verrucomicrobia bacterium]|nr:DUF1772 domain-containing protein [Verrucomicrobiota bacterium]